MSQIFSDKKNARLSKTAFVTIGATAVFRSLLIEVASRKFLETLQALNFTDLVVQCGPDLDFFNKIKFDNVPETDSLTITTFSYAPDLKQYYLQASKSDGGEGGKRDRGVIISHAGSGSILEALEVDSKLVAVPNPELMDNHQLEIAEEMEAQGFLIHAALGSVAEAVGKAETTTLRKWPPEPSPDSAYQKGGLWEAINELMP
ncbi:glycosyltransferase family 1 protein [Astrocystis sublimbata]|nr:glycosyltransferase family 1 protein [Astrocystis sublimbata]